MSKLIRTRSLPSGLEDVQVKDEQFVERTNSRPIPVGMLDPARMRSRPNLKKNNKHGSNSSSRSPSAPDEYKDPFFNPPPRLGVRSAPLVQSSLSDDTPNLDSLLESDSLLNVEISSSIEGTNFYIPLSLMVEREITMRKTAEEFGIGPERWSSSLLYREWRKAQDDISSTAEDRAFQLSNGDVTIYLSPEIDCAASNHSQSLKWTPWLTTCIRAFYNTGTVRFPNDCVGSDVLLALEYFGIVYTPDQLVFDSFGAYLRVKLWSEYFTHRSGLAQWVVETLMQTNSKHSHLFVTSPSLQEGDLLVGSKRADILDGHLQLDPTKYSGTPSNAVVHDFFHDEDRPEDVEYPLDSLMRDDFAHYIEKSLPGTRVTFTLRDVQVVKTGKTVKRATLHVAFVEPPKQTIVMSKVRRTVAKDAPGRLAPRSSNSSRSSALSRIQVPAPPPRGTRMNMQMSSEASRRTPSPSSAMLKRVGSTLRKSNSSNDGSDRNVANSRGSGNLSKSSGTTPGTSVSDVLLNKLRLIPIASQVDEDENAAIRERSRCAISSVDGILGGKSQIPPESKCSSLSESKCQSLPEGSVIPSNETDVALIGPIPTSPAPFDEEVRTNTRCVIKDSLDNPAKDEITDPRAPVNAIWEGDLNTVVSALTSPFREDESVKPSKSSALSEASPILRPVYSDTSPIMAMPSVNSHLKPIPSNSSTRKPISSQEKESLPQAKKFKSEEEILKEEQHNPHKKVVKDVAMTHNLIQRILHEDATVDTATEINVSSLATDQSTMFDPFRKMQSTHVPECGSGDLVSSTIAYFFGSTPSGDKQKPERVIRCPRPDDLNFDMASLAGKGKGAMSTIEDFLPDIDLQTYVEDASSKQGKSIRITKASSSDPPLETIESSAATWLRRAINVNQMIFDDPVPTCEGNDEYLSLVRQAEPDTYNECIRIAQQKTATAGILVKDILESLLNDNNSLLGGSVASTDASTANSATGSVSTPSTRLTKAGPFIPFECDSSIESTDNTRDDAVKKLDDSKKKVKVIRSKPATPISSLTLPRLTSSTTGSSKEAAVQSRTPSRERLRRFPTPRRNVDRPLSSQPKSNNREKTDIASSTSRPTTPTGRHASPLARLPALISGRKRGKNRGDETTETELTAKVYNGVKIEDVGSTINGKVSTEATVIVQSDSRDETTPGTSRLAGLFRSKGLVRRKSPKEGGP